jgi:acetyltransferase-like isoleucine patch superfamily enzyme
VSYRRAGRIFVRPLIPLAGPLRGLRRRWMRERLIIRVKLLAASVDATVEVIVARDVQIDGLPMIDIYPQTANKLVVGSGALIGDGIRISLRGGSLEIGDGTEVRRLGTYSVAGRVSIGRDVLMSNGIMVHCAESIEIGDLTIIGEYTTITDSRHLRTDVGDPVRHATAMRPVKIGRNIWIGAHAVITAGVEVGDQSFIGGGAVVTKNVDPWWLVAGVPAVPIRKLDPPTS